MHDVLCDKENKRQTQRQRHRQIMRENCMSNCLVIHSSLLIPHPSLKLMKDNALQEKMRNREEEVRRLEVPCYTPVERTLSHCERDACH